MKTQHTRKLTQLAKSSLMLGFIPIIWSGELKAQSLSPASLFSRCYSNMTGIRVPADHPLLIDTINKNTQQVAISNCLKVFDKGRLRIYDGAPVTAKHAKISNLVNPNDMESVAVLNYFFSLYNSYFREKSFESTPITYGTDMFTMVDISEDALFLLKSTFHGDPANSSSANQFVNQTPIDSILKGTESLMGKRSLPQKYAHRQDTCTNAFRNCGFTPMFAPSLSPRVRVWGDLPSWDYQNANGSAPGEGFLTGLKTWPEGHNTFFTLDSKPVTPDVIIGKTTEDIPRSQGGGILGAIGYLVKNSQYAGNTDGAVRNRRRIVKNIFSSLLCRDMPPLRLDSAPVLQRVSDYASKPFTESKKLPFRQSVTCASCHVAFDEAAAVYRNTWIRKVALENIDWNADGYIDSRAGQNMDAYSFFGTTNATSPVNVVDPHLVNGVSDGAFLADSIYRRGDFYASKPSGKLVFQDWRGQLIELRISASSGTPVASAGIQELGEALAETDQFYACMVKRIFNHFTGINVSLEDHGDSRLPPLSAAETYYRDNYIIPLALGDSSREGLKSHKSIRRLIADIISSDIYKSTSMRDSKK